MTNTTETIAAFIAERTPIGSTYRLLPIPGTELCENNMSSIKTDWSGVVFFDPIGIDGMTLEQALANYAEHNDEHDVDHADNGAPCHCDYCQVWIPMAHKVESDSADKNAQVQSLREQLDAAHATLRYIRRIIESEDSPGERTRDVYDATAKALPY